MKILFLTNIASPYRIKFFNELGKVVDLTVIFERKRAKNRNDNWLKSKFNNFKAEYLSGIKISNDSSFSLSILDWLKKDFDLIVIGGYSTPSGILAICYLNLKGIPFLLNVDGGIVNKEENIVKYNLKKYLISSAFAWLSTGKEANKYLEYYGAKERMIFEYPFTSVKEKDILESIISEQEKEKLRNEIDIEGKNIVLSVGQFIKRKGFDILLKAANGLDKDIGIYIIGGKPTQEYINIKNKFNLENVHFIDFMKKEKLIKYYLAADLFVLPTREDIWGLVINEAMSYGLPVITTNNCVAGLELITDNENGYIIPTENSVILREKIKKILRDEILKEKMGKNNLDKIKKFTIEAMAEEHLNIFDYLIKSQRYNK